ncbi:DNA polymerase Y family protein [Vineibacter terrae]|uniref:DNA polymerase Y family protein n=1 Tax=Vineibacter terrae TaxID=2586908 RepID=A0A5C8PDY8_9HYPH|nr:DNA polymerase Y family protein [Vineibacter terrae]TXL71987.1 DNA polymerase Y family protein [Vineibacter terrae]
MSRIVSVWLKSWPIARLLRARSARTSAAPSDSLDPQRPLVLVASGTGGARLVALNAAAWRCGLAVGDLLSNARSKVLDLQVRDADPAADSDALRRLALWCLRYTPVVAPWETGEASGLFLDITGCAHLFGGEDGLLADLATRLRRFGLNPRPAVADTAGAAWAVARFTSPTQWGRWPKAGGGSDEMSVTETTSAPLRPCGAPPQLSLGRDIHIIPPDQQQHTLRDLPLAALRLDASTQAVLCRLGFRRIGELMRQPRAPLAARFGASLLLRLDQALGREAELLSPLEPPPSYRTHAVFAEAISLQAHVVEATTRLLRRLMPDLARDGVGIRILRLLLFRLDGEVQALQLGLAAPSRDVAHVARLIAMRLERLPMGLAADFGFEAAALHVTAAERIVQRQASLGIADEAGEAAGLAPLIDRLEHRLGAGAVRRLQPQQSHIPERAVVARAAAEAPAADWRIEAPFGMRPPLLLAPPEKTDDVLASVPEGPPRRFRWRGVLHEVAHAEGPERIAPEWWRPGPDATERDYYVVEDTAGRRFWLFRAGHYDATPTPPWFVHGVFP